MPAYRTFRPPHQLSDPLREFLHTAEGSDFTSLTSLFPAEWNTVVMGGLLRDLLLERIPKIDAKPADMDLVIFGAGSIDEIRGRLGVATQSANAFGGAKCQLRPGGMVFDLWRVEDHTNMAKASLPHTIEQLLRRNLLDIDAILWDPATDVLHDCGSLGAIKARQIDLMGPQGISREFPANQLAHVLVIAFKTKFPLSDDLCAFVADTSSRCRAIDVENMLARKVPQFAAEIRVLWNEFLSGGTQRCRAPMRATRR